MASSSAVAKALQATMAAHGERVNRVAAGADLGVDAAAGRRRSTKVARARRAKADKRARAVARYAKMAPYAAAKLYRVGACARLSHGAEAFNMARTTLRSVRAQQAKATGKWNPGMCVATLVELVYGPGQDAVDMHQVLQLKAWMRLLADHPELGKRLEKRWPRVLARAGNPRTRWLFARGPASAAACSLLDLG